MFKKELFYLLLFCVSGCGFVPSLDTVVSDNRDKYKASKSLPDLEIPPDLTSEALEDSLAIPDEEQTNVFSEFQKRKALRQNQQADGIQAIDLSDLENTQFIVTGERFEIWSELRNFLLDTNFVLSIEDFELGVLETEFKNIEVAGVVEQREKINIFLDDLENTGELSLVLESEQQENISDDAGEVIWSDSEKSAAKAREWLASISAYLSANSAEVETVTDAVVSSEPALLDKAKAELLNTGDKKYLLIPSGFSQAWHDIEKALQAAGFYVAEKHEDTAMYSIIYYPAHDDPEQEAGLLDKLALWKDKEESVLLKISLTGVGETTEVTVLDEQGKWIDSEESSQMLSKLEVHYNQLFN